ncbi:MAG: sugar ABC transporter permease, partial [Clostridiales bacterium]|nr:sugar ABC transporter permease [Clostridiales bacterium]
QMVAVAAIFRSWFRTDGFINNMLINLFGVAEENVPKWLANSTLSRIPVLLLLVWSSLGYLIIVYMGALQNVPVSLYEAAEIDGANKTQQFRHITIPLVSQTTFYLLIVRMIAVFKVFTSVNVLTWKTSSKGSVSIVQEVYSTAFGDFNFGKGSAQSWVLVGIILIFTFIQFKGQKKWVHY